MMNKKLLVSLTTGSVLGLAAYAVFSPIPIDGAKPSQSSQTTISTSPSQNSMGNPSQSGYYNPAQTSNYNDGKYNTEVEYYSPNGVEKIVLTVVLKDNTVQKITCDNIPSSNASYLYQNQFKKSCEKEVKGQKIADLNITRVSSSSLTLNGFLIAVEKIKDQARKT